MHVVTKHNHRICKHSRYSTTPVTMVTTHHSRGPLQCINGAITGGINKTQACLLDNKRTNVKDEEEIIARFGVYTF